MAAGLETAAELSVRANPSSPRSTNQHPCPGRGTDASDDSCGGGVGLPRRVCTFLPILNLRAPNIKADTHYP